MKLRSLVLVSFCVLCVSVVNAFSLDREAFTFTNYDLDVRIEPGQQRLGVRGKVTLRNDSSTPQKNAVLQISSSLSWRSITHGDKPLQFISQPYTSDIDHTGALSEAIVTLPEAVAPKASVDLEIAYEGVIILDATRLTRIGAPEDQANSSDWDQISAKFTAVRGIGYVAWYPIATEAAAISDGNDVGLTVDRWKARHANSSISVFFQSTVDEPILFSGNPNGFVVQTDQHVAKMASFGMLHMGTNVPTFLQANYRKLDANGISAINYLPGSEASAQAYVEALTNLDPLPTAKGSRHLQVAQLPDSNAAEFVSESILLLPLKPSATEQDKLAIVYAIAKGETLSPRPWIAEGLAHYAQAADVEQRHGHAAALAYLTTHSSALAQSEIDHSPTKPTTEAESNALATQHSLINSTDELYLESKAMYVWWMLHDLLRGNDPAFFLVDYDPAKDNEPSYVQRLIEKISKHDLEWFFDDWVYRDRGLPDFKVASAFTRKTLPEGYMLTITVENLGAAGAEVPVTVKFEGGEITKRLVVRSKSNGVIRVEVSKPPQEIVVNDGSVPESDTSNNTFKIEATDVTK